MMFFQMNKALLLIASVAALLLRSACQADTAVSPGVHLIENARKSGQPTVVEFGANSCTTCRNMKPILDATALLGGWG